MSEEVEVKNLNHLGIVAGIIDEIEIEEIVNNRLGKDEREKISAGKIVKAIIINGLGFISRPLYLFPEYYQDKPVEELLGEGIKASEINDDKIGRVMDKLWEYGLEKIWTEIGIKTVRKYQIETKYSHLDSSSISVEGEYSETEEGLIKITYGYSKDKRPDLKQFLINLMVSSDGDVPLFLEMGSGNESDKSKFTSVIRNYQKEVDWETIYVADSALYTAKNLQEMGETKWLSRVPLSIKKAKERLEKIREKELTASSQEGYKYKEEIVNYHGIKQRWLIVESEKRKESDLDKLEKKLKKEKEKVVKQLRKWQEKKRKNLPELKVEVKQFIKKLKYQEIIEIKYKQELDKKQELVYSCQGEIREKAEIINKERKRAGRFIIATNVLDEKELSSEEMLSEYKAQQSCERGFRFLKDPLFLTSSVFLKSPKRIETMGMLMGLCLLVYSLGQRMIRQQLNLRKGQVRNNNGKLTNQPTLRWIFQVLQGIHLVKINQKNIVSNLTKEKLEILKYFTVYCQNYYLAN